MASRECDDEQSGMSPSTQHRMKLLQDVKEEIKKDRTFINELKSILLTEIAKEHQQQPTASTDDDKNAHTNKSPVLPEQQNCKGEEQGPCVESEEESNLSATDKGVNKMYEVENNIEPMKAVIKNPFLPKPSASKNECMKTGSSTTEAYADESINCCSTYNMNHPRRGHAVIFSHKHFSENLNLCNKDSADIDARKLRRIFERFNFTPEIYMDKKYEEIIEILNNLAGQDHSEEDCLVVAVSTAGEKGFLMASDRPYTPENLWTPFIGTKCPSLAGKPKLFFIEASQGDKFDCGVDVPSHMTSDTGSGTHRERYRIPSHADLIIMNSSVEGFYSWRRRPDGGWFISALSDVLLQSNGSEDLLTLLHQVSGKVALEYESFASDSNRNRCKQVPSIRSTLTRKIYLTPEVPTGRQQTETSQISEYNWSSRIHHKLAPYSMDHCERGFAIILDNEIFEPGRNLVKRTGSNLDASSLQEVFQLFNFTTKIYANQKSYEIHNLLSVLASMDHSDEDCLIVAVLTHGQKAGVLYAADNPYPEEMLWSPFLGENCPSLAGKPKIFLIQACRGMEFDPGVVVKTRDLRDSGSSKSRRIPSYADFLIVHSSFEGFTSWRNTTAGSWFIKSFCAEMMQQDGKFSFLDLLTRVCQRVATDYESVTPHLPHQHAMKQMPSIYSTLTKDFIFWREDSKRVSKEIHQAVTASRQKSSVQVSREFQLNQTAALQRSPVSDSVAVKNEHLIKDITSTLEPHMSRFSIPKYPMNFKKRGRAIIFNHETYNLGYCKDRKGTQNDVNKLESVFKHMGFEPITKNNLHYHDIMETLNKEAEFDHSDSDCLVVCVLSHGCDYNGNMICAYDVPYLTQYLWKPFKNEKCSLRGKPKMFFIQACRGEDDDPGVILQKKVEHPKGNDPGKDHQEMNERVRTERKKSEKDYANSVTSSCLPPDTLIAHSCSKNFGAYKFEDFGSYFIQFLAEELFNGCKNLDLVKILTQTSRRMAVDFETTDGCKQMPVIRSTLRAKIYFESKKESRC